VTRRLTLILAAILGILAAAQAQAAAHVAPPVLQRVAAAHRYLEFRTDPPRARQTRSASTGARVGTNALSPGAGTIGVLPSARVGNGPQGAAFDRTNDTVYVANQNDNTVSVVDARHCNALDTSGCAQTSATVTTGGGPFSIAIDDATHTVYVANQNDNTLSVINAATCNGHRSSGCAHAGRKVAAGRTPFGIAVDPGTGTVYVTDVGGHSDTVSVIDGATCNAIRTTGCRQRPAKAKVGHFPFGLLVDRHDHTVYVTDAADDRVSMIDRRTCNATETGGCARPHPTVGAGSFPAPLTLDRRTGSLYVGSQNFANPSTSAPGKGPTVVVIDARRCNARKTAGCARRHPTMTVAGGTDGMSIDQRTDTLFVSNNGPGPSPAQRRSVSVINAGRCNAHTTVGCGQHAPTALTGRNPGGNTHDPRTDTEYVTTGDNTLQVIDGATCRAGNVTGCGQPAPSALAGLDPFSIAINPASRSVYVGDTSEFEGVPWSMSVLNAARCNTTRHRGCSAARRNAARPAGQFALTADPMTNTLYSSDLLQDASGHFGDDISVINGARCKTSASSSCGATRPRLTVPGGAAGSAENLKTHTLYVVDHSKRAVSVFDAASCNAAEAAGCSQTATQIHLGAIPLAVAVNQATDTIYALEPGRPSTVSVIDGARCNAAVRGGCGRVPPTVAVGNAANFEGLAVDEATDTVYVDNTGDDTVSVIDGTFCNAAVTSGCGQRPTTVRVGDQNFGSVAVDQTRNLIYVTNGLDDTVSVIDGTTCNGTTHTSCGRSQPTVPAGAGPSTVAVDPATQDAYVLDNDGATASFIRFVAPRKPTRVTTRLRRGRTHLRWRRPYAGGLPIIYHVISSPACPRCTGLTTQATSRKSATVIAGLVHGTTYTFRVVARDAAGNGPPSAPSNPITP
jgi:DNA-binding beta-propeller fold protein YncE